jgi:hypothetical protein
MAKQEATGNSATIILKAAGWALLEQYYNNFLNANFPLGIQLGYVTPLGYGETEHDMSLNITGQSPSGFYSVVNGLRNSPNNIPISEYGF